jgi:hypothetical protein
MSNVLGIANIKTGIWVWNYFLPIGYSKIVSEKRVNYRYAPKILHFPPLVRISWVFGKLIWLFCWISTQLVYNPHYKDLPKSRTYSELTSVPTGSP